MFADLLAHPGVEERYAPGLRGSLNRPASTNGDHASYEEDGLEGNDGDESARPSGRSS